MNRHEKRAAKAMAGGIVDFRNWLLLNRTWLQRHSDENEFAVASLYTLIDIPRRAAKIFSGGRANLMP
jgi:hypothetical protein